MSRMIRGAILQGEPVKIVVNLNRSKKIETTAAKTGAPGLESVSAEQDAAENVYDILFEENKRKMEELLNSAQTQHNAIIADANSERQAILAQAAEEAAKLREEAGAVLEEARLIKENSAKQGQEEGYAKGYETGNTDGKTAGYEEGYAAGIAKAQDEMTALINEAAAKAQNVVELAEREKKRYIIEAEQDILTLVLDVVNKVIPQQFIDYPQLIFPIIKAALEKVKDQESLCIRVSPIDYEMVLLGKSELQSLLDVNTGLKIVADQSLQPGGCLIESENGSVDARIDKQIEVISKALQDVMHDEFSNR